MPPEISVDESLAKNDPAVSSDPDWEDEEVTCDSSDERAILPDPSPARLSARHDRGRRLPKAARAQIGRPAAQRKNGEFQCYECHRSFAKIEELLSHQRKHTAKRHPCPECGKFFARKQSLIRHQKTHAGEEPFPCWKCDRAFILKANLLSHLRTHADPKETKISKKSDRVKMRPKWHMLNKEYEIPPEISTDREQHPVTPPTSGVQDGVVACGHSEANPVAPDPHPDRASPTSAGDLPDDRRPVTRHIASAGDGAFSCYECEISFSHIKHLLAHQRTHRPKKSFTCSDCGKTFPFRAFLVTHARKHTGEKPFPCPACGKCFSLKSSVKVHMRVHTGEKPHVCSECGMAFAVAALLAFHKWGHTGERPFACDECGKRFRQKATLHVHQRVHTGELPYGCPECGKGFSQRAALVAHKRVHTGEKPYSCPECAKSFKVKNHLDTHRKKLHPRRK